MAEKGKGKGSGDGSGAALQVSREGLEGISKAIADLDVKIQSSSGSGAAAKKAVEEQLFQETKDLWGTDFEDFMNYVQGLDSRAFVGMINALRDWTTLKETTDRVTKVVDGILTEQSQASSSEIESLRNERKEKLALFNALKVVLSSAMNVDVSDIEPPRATRGAAKGQGAGGTKVRTKGKIDFYTIENAEFDEAGNYVSNTGTWKPVDKDYNSFGSVAFNYSRVPEAQGGGRMTAPEIIKYIEEKGIDWKNTDSTGWAVKLPNENVIGGKRPEKSETETSEEVPQEQVA